MDSPIGSRPVDIRYFEGFTLQMWFENSGAQTHIDVTWIYPKKSLTMEYLINLSLALLVLLYSSNFRVGIN